MQTPDYSMSSSAQYKQYLLSKNKVNAVQETLANTNSTYEAYGLSKNRTSLPEPFKEIEEKKISNFSIK